jgi:polyisoprenoid-binding protein YceI
MREIHSYAIGVFAAAALLVPSIDAAEWRIDPAHSAAQFSVRHMMVSTVRGGFERMTGTIHWDPATPEQGSVEVEVDTTTVNTRNERRDNHLRSADFLEAEKYPTMTFVSTKVERAGEGRLKLTGVLTLRGVTREVVFDVEGPVPPIPGQRGRRSGATATAKINRSDFGLTWNRAIEAGGVTVGDEVTITMDIEMTEVTGNRPGDSS